MGFFDSINRALFSLTYNEQASKAYDQQNQQAVGAVEDIKKQIEQYRETRDRIIAANESTDYFSSNSISRITEWENWLQKNGGLAAGDYTQKSTEMKTQWESLLNINPIVKEMSRVSEFIDLFMKDKDTKIPAEAKKELETLKKAADEYYKGIVKKTPADIVKKREEFNQTFEAIQKKIPENFENLTEPYQDKGAPTPTLLAGITDTGFRQYKNQVEKKEVAEENTFSFSRMASRSLTYFQLGFGIVFPIFFGLVFGMIVANDAIGRPAVYRFFYFFATLVLFYYNVIPGMTMIFSVGIFLYYLYRAITAVNWSNVFSLNPEGPRLDYLSAPVLFAFLPIYEAKEGIEIPWYTRIFTYSESAYDGLARKKRLLYEKNAASLVGKQMEDALEVVSETIGSETFREAVDKLKKAI